MASVTGPVFVLGEYLVFVAFVFHALNGVRLFWSSWGSVWASPSSPSIPTALHSTCSVRWPSER